MPCISPLTNPTVSEANFLLWTSRFRGPSSLPGMSAELVWLAKLFFFLGGGAEDKIYNH